MPVKTDTPCKEAGRLNITVVAAAPAYIAVLFSAQTRTFLKLLPRNRFAVR